MEIQSLKKEIVCVDCLSLELLYSDCICTYMKNYPTIEMEFEYCKCCGRTNTHPADTEFNDKQYEKLNNDISNNSNI